jgi:hypothetical protein
MNRRPVTLAVTSAVAALAVAACGESPGAPPPQTASAPPAAATSTVPHGDHNPHHGGVVMMKGDLHYEVVFDPTGREHRVYFSDAAREDLPAALAAAVALTIHRPGEADEPIALKIDDSGESWMGSGKPIASPGTASARVAFTVAGDAYWIDVPLAPGK